MRQVLVTIACAASLIATPAAAQQAPRVDIVHLGLFERYCIGGQTPQPGVVAEIGRRLPEFRAAWAAEGPRLLAAAARIAGQPFRFQETVATLQGCHGVASMSFPLTIEVARFTEAAGGAPVPFGPREPRAATEAMAPPPPVAPRQPPLPMRRFVYLLWHEVMHRYVTDTVAALRGGTTPLLGKYAAENAIVRNHIHMFAIETLLWRQLGREAETVERIAEIRARSARPYLRAYEIVAAESAEALVEDLRRPQ